MEFKTMFILFAVLALVGFVLWKGPSNLNPFQSKNTSVANVVQPQIQETYQPPPVVIQDTRNTRYGIEPGNLNFFTISTEPKIYKNIGAMMVKLAANKNGAQWSTIQPSRDVWNFANMDYFVNEWQKEGYEVVVVIRSDAGWAVKPVYRRNDFTKYGEKTSTAPFNMQDYSTYLNKIFERYDKNGIDDATELINQIKYYQIEEEVSTERDFQGTKQEYETMLSTAYDLAKIHNASIITGGLNFFTMLDNSTEMQPYQIDDTLAGFNNSDSKRLVNFTRTVLLSDKYDIIQVNHMGNYTSITNIKTFINTELFRYGIRDKQVWVSDYSAPYNEYDFPIPYEKEDYELELATSFYVLNNPSHPDYNATYEWYTQSQSSNLAKKMEYYNKNSFDKISICCIPAIADVDVTLS